MRWANSKSGSRGTLYILFMSMTDDWFLDLVKPATIKNKNSGKEYINKEFLDSLYRLYDEYYKQILPYRDSTISFNTMGAYIVKSQMLLNNLSRLDGINQRDLDKFYGQLDSLTREFRERIKPNNTTSATNEFNPELKRQLIESGRFQSGYISNLQRRSDPMYTLNKTRLEKTSKQAELDYYMTTKWRLGNNSDPIYQKLKADLNAINSDLAQIKTRSESRTARTATRNTRIRGGKTRKNTSK